MEVRGSGGGRSSERDRAEVDGGGLRETGRGAQRERGCAKGMGDLHRDRQKTTKRGENEGCVRGGGTGGANSISGLPSQAVVGENEGIHRV